MVDIDFKRMLEQEPEFAEFVKETMFIVYVQTEPKLISILYALYQSGMPVDTAVTTLKLMLGTGGANEQNRNNS